MMPGRFSPAVNFSVIGTIWLSIDCKFVSVAMLTD